MARYFVIGPTYVKHSGVAVPAVVPPGEVIEYSGAPGSSLVAVDAEGLEMKRRVRTNTLQERRYRARLPKNIAARLAELEDALEAELESERDTAA